MSVHLLERAFDLPPLWDDHQQDGPDALTRREEVPPHWLLLLLVPLLLVLAHAVGDARLLVLQRPVADGGDVVS